MTFVMNARVLQFVRKREALELSGVSQVAWHLLESPCTQ